MAKIETIKIQGKKPEVYKNIVSIVDTEYDFWQIIPTKEIDDLDLCAIVRLMPAGSDRKGKLDVIRLDAAKELARRLGHELVLSETYATEEERSANYRALGSRETLEWSDFRHGTPWYRNANFAR
ncbi:MAG: hypothetical protein WCI57_02405 [Candidatus Berkelbacteria bacterium]